MRSNKKLIIAGAVITILALAAAGFYFYKNGYFTSGRALTPEILLSSFKVTNSSLSAEAAQLFTQRFEETKTRLQSDPDSFNDWLYLGVLKKGAGDYEGARDVFIYAGQIRPQSSTPFVNLADLYAYFLNESAKAEASLQTAIANDPNDYNLYLALADIYRYKFTDGGAKYEQTLLAAVAKFPDNANLIAPLAAYFRDTNQTAKAIQWYKELVRLSPDNAQARQDLAALEARQ